MRDVTEALLRVLTGGGRGALATVVRTTGSTPQRPGARMLQLPDGGSVGTIGGGAVEAKVLCALASCRESGRPELMELDLGRDLGMCCGGNMVVFVEPVQSEQRLLIFGAGHVACATATLAKTVGFSVTVIDDREELNNSERFPTAERILAEPAEAAARLAPRSEDWLLIVTHDHRLDEEALRTYASLPHRYLGMIGSRRKTFRILQRLAARGPVPALDRVYAPVGLDLGAVSPEEIAVSIVAELVALRHGKRPAHLRVVDAPEVARLLQRAGARDVTAPPARDTFEP